MPSKPTKTPAKKGAPTPAKAPDAASQSFRFTAPAAANVLLAGDFTHWQEQAITMKRGTKGVWTADVPLAPGAYHYRFIVDGEWVGDPDCALLAPNPFGGENSVRVVG